MHHRLSRALTHDDAQIAQWLAFEQNRITASRSHVVEKEEHLISLTNGYFPTKSSDALLRPSEGLEGSMWKLQREMSNRSQRLLEAEDEEDRAREVSVTAHDFCHICLKPLILCVYYDHITDSCHEKIFAIISSLPLQFPCSNSHLSSYYHFSTLLFHLSLYFPFTRLPHKLIHRPTKTPYEQEKQRPVA